PPLSLLSLHDALPIPGRIFQHHQSPQLRPAQHEYFFVAYDSRRHCGSDYRNRDDGAADTIGPEAHLLTLFSGWLRLRYLGLTSGDRKSTRLNSSHVSI